MRVWSAKLEAVVATSMAEVRAVEANEREKLGRRESRRREEDIEFLAICVQFAR